jgi:flagellar basal-body rod protein FlgC
MDYFNAFAISASGMVAEKTRTDTVALNLANMNSGKGVDGKLFKPLHVHIVPGKFAADFARQAGGVQVAGIEELDVAPRAVYEPGHPDADAKGMVSMPGVDQVKEMATMSAALRAYQANVVAFNAAKTMALKALEMGAQ